ncbi:RsmF rRNA methyltransferase first C-terminal domain-containing protein [Bacillus sp. T33-2]|uniref:RsmF rRNA methyltransferase first C-terminal domain-containing protein n=1 Tax=Bacillus sp. T33-2 TaxID=2054168 RepID=UPI000C75F598|nr:RsmB/NOP family class I SAM-dependent RNA methyltransferase [Bacillus sp. T33-2]PLR98885.1 SAM-dependent methyltransferase [Bacillus sp. T33-2]
MDLPTEFKQKMTRLLQEEAGPFFSTYEQPKASGLRINPLKISQKEWDKLSPFPLKKIPFVHGGYYYEPDETQPGKHPYHQAGLYYIQEPSAMFVAGQLAPAPGERVLDLCAAPGGKTTQLAGMMENKGMLVANEINPKRAKALSENIERLGVTNTIVLNEAPAKLAGIFAGYFDKILVDAPCSGEGMFRKDGDAVRFWSEDHMIDCSILQRDILKSAYSMLKEGGILVYSTCTFSPEENEQSVERFLADLPDIELVEIKKENGIAPGNPDWSNTGLMELEKTARLWPHLLRGEGHFTAKFRKSGVSGASKVKSFTSNAPRSQIKDFDRFKEMNLSGVSYDNYFLAGQQIYSLPGDAFDLKGLKVVRPGLHLGEFKKNRFEPNHSLAIALSAENAKNIYSVSSTGDDWLRYLKGNTFSTGLDRGWILITVDGFPIGWGKEAKGIIKNFYPKGLRILG